MELADIRLVARHQRRRGVGTVEIAAAGQRVRIRIGRNALADTPDAVPSATACATDTGTLVTAEGLGLLRREHPARLDARIAVGDAVAAGQPLALLQVGSTYTAVIAPHSGVVEALLAEDGQRIDYGTPLFRLRETAL